MFPEAQSPDPERTNAFRLLLAYDGTDYFGWQVQPGRRTIQGTLAEAMRQCFGEQVLPQGSGRTDTGVHAEGQVVSVSLRASIPADRLLRVLNRRLPSAIRVVSAVAVAHEFHARANVLHKTYEYRIFQRRTLGRPAENICPPTLARFVWDCRWPLQLLPMAEAAEHLLGTHDYTSFAAHDPDRAARQRADASITNVRTIDRCAWEHRDDLLVFRVTGSGFLHHMVRNIVGTCVLAGAGRLSPAAVPGILAARNRQAAGPTAPPQGLHLVEVVYCDDSSAPWIDGLQP